MSGAHIYEACEIKAGDVILIEGGPCKVTKKTSAKSGKHGAAKQLFTADNVFTGKRFQLNVTGGSKWTRVHSTKKEYEIMDMDTKEGTITCMGEGDDCEELTFNYDKFGQQEGDKLKESFDDGKLCIAQTLKSYTQKKEGEDIIEEEVIKGFLIKDDE